MMKRTLILSFLAMGAASLASGQILVAYYFDAVENSPPAADLPGIAGGVSSLTADSFAALDAAGLTASNQVDFTNAGGISNTGWDLRTGSSWPWTETDELDAVYTNGNITSFDATTADPTDGGPGDFFSFTITNNSGDSWSIDEFNYDVALQAGDGDMFHFAEIRVDNNSVWSAGSFTETGRMPRTDLGHGFDLTGEGLSISDGGSAEFRVYYASNRSGTDRLAIANLEAVVIPEPSTYAALFGLLAIGFVAWRRRRRA